MSVCWSLLYIHVCSRVNSSRQWCMTKHSLFTARVRSTTGGYVFTGLCLSNFRGGEYPIQLMGGPIPGLDWGGVPHLADGVPYPSWRNGGYPILGSDMRYPIQLMGGVPHLSWWGVPHVQDWMGYPPPIIASTCYAAGSMPLAFTQKDFLVLSLRVELIISTDKRSNILPFVENVSVFNTRQQLYYRTSVILKKVKSSLKVLFCMQEQVHNQSALWNRWW